MPSNQWTDSREMREREREIVKKKLNMLSNIKLVYYTKERS